MQEELVVGDEGSRGGILAADDRRKIERMRKILAPMTLILGVRYDTIQVSEDVARYSIDSKTDLLVPELRYLSHGHLTKRNFRFDLIWNGGGLGMQLGVR